MGQQQLLLIILVTIIVGIATVVALNTFSAAAEAASRNSLNLDLAIIASSAQGYYLRPQMLGGDGRSFENIDFTKFAFSGWAGEEDVLQAANESGTNVISGIAAGEFIVTGTIGDQRGTTMSARICPHGFRLGQLGYGTSPAPPACI